MEPISAWMIWPTFSSRLMRAMSSVDALGGGSTRPALCERGHSAACAHRARHQWMPRMRQVRRRAPRAAEPAAEQHSRARMMAAANVGELA